MSTEILPSLPRSYKVSELLCGDNAGFIINAYLALQRQWPDQGGYQHYLYVLSTYPDRRADVLHEIAASPVAQRCGSELIDDHDSVNGAAIDPELQYLRQCVNLRIPQLARALDSRNGHEPEAGNVQTDVARLQQRVDEQGKEIASLRRELRNMAARLGAAGVPALNGASVEAAVPAALVAEVEQLKATVGPLHHFATVELKRLIADYTNALLTAHLDAVR
jgi:hypothetical protein